jgi:hypothetical protein
MEGAAFSQFQCSQYNQGRYDLNGYGKNYFNLANPITRYDGLLKDSDMTV